MDRGLESAHRLPKVVAKVDDMVNLASYGGSEASGSTKFLAGEPVAGIHSFLFQFENTSEPWADFMAWESSRAEDKSTKFRPSADYLFNLSIASWPSAVEVLWDMGESDVFDIFLEASIKKFQTLKDTQRLHPCHSGIGVPLLAHGHLAALAGLGVRLWGCLKSRRLQPQDSGQRLILSQQRCQQCRRAGSGSQWTHTRA